MPGSYLIGLPALACLLLAVGMWRAWSSWIVLALLALGAEYALSLGDNLDGTVPLEAAGCLLVAELAYWCTELRAPATPERGTLIARFSLMSALVAGSVVVAAVMIAAAGLAPGGGRAWEAVGLAAAAGALALVVVLARER